MITNLIILGIFLVLSAFFSASEVAFISLNEAKVETMVKRKLPRAKKIKKMMKNPRRLLVTILIGNNIVNIASASFATVIATDLFDSGAIGIATGVMTLLVLIFGEIIPKSYAGSHYKKFAIFSSPFLQFLQLVLFPFVITFEWLTNLFAGKETQDRVSEEELRAMAIAGAKQGAIEKDERAMLERLFEFNDITAEDIMTPRVQMIALEKDATMKEAIAFVEQHPHTRFPVIGESTDDVVGFVHARDILIASNKKKKTLKSILHPILRIPKQIKLDDLLREFQKANVHIGLVLDEYGGTLGLITLEDVLEELVGEIVDEHDVEDNIIKRVDKNTVIVAGDENIRDINDYLNCAIPGDPFDTIAEIILDKTGKVPRKNTEVELGNVIATILLVKNRVISKVKVEKKQ